MTPGLLQEATEQLWQAILIGQGMALYPRLESLLQEENVPQQDWVPALELGSAIYLWHGRFAEGERLARRAVARSLPSSPSGVAYLRAILALARAFACQDRLTEARAILHEALTHSHPHLVDWIGAHEGLFQKGILMGESPPLAPHWSDSMSIEERLRAMARPDPFPLWTGSLLWGNEPLREIPLWQSLPYPLSLDTVAAWAGSLRDGPDHDLVRPLLHQVKLWRKSQLQVGWLGSVGKARFTYHLRVQLECPGRSPQWLSLEVGGSGYERVSAQEPKTPNLTIVDEQASPVYLPCEGGSHVWKVLFRGASNVVKSGLRAVLRVGFETGPPLQAIIMR